MPDTIQPQQLIDALTANGWTVAGSYTGLGSYVRLERANVQGQTFVVITDTSAPNYGQVGSVLAELARHADTGRRASRVLASLSTTAPQNLGRALTDAEIINGFRPSDEILRGRVAIEAVDQVKSSTDEENRDPAAGDPGPTHRAQSSGRLAWEIARDLRQCGPDAGPLLFEAADKLDRQAVTVADECSARDAAQRAVDRAEAELVEVKRDRDAAISRLQIAAAGDGLDLSPAVERITAIAPGVALCGDTWLPADVIAGWRHAGGRIEPDAPDVPVSPCSSCHGTRVRLVEFGNRIVSKLCPDCGEAIVPTPEPAQPSQ